MDWDSIFFIVTGTAWVTITFVVLGSNRKLIGVVRELTKEAAITTAGLSRTIHCLSYRVSKNGWVEISEEEWIASEESNVKIFRNDEGKGVRVLAK